MKISRTPSELGLAAGGFEFLALAEIGGEGDDLAAVGGLQPAQDDAGVQAAGVGEHDLADRFFGHGSSGLVVSCQSSVVRCRVCWRSAQVLTTNG